MARKKPRVAPTRNAQGPVSPCCSHQSLPCSATISTTMTHSPLSSPHQPERLVRECAEGVRERRRPGRHRRRRAQERPRRHREGLQNHASDRGREDAQHIPALREGNCRCCENGCGPKQLPRLPARSAVGPRVDVCDGSHRFRELRRHRYEELDGEAERNAEGRAREVAGARQPPRGRLDGLHVDRRCVMSRSHASCGASRGAAVAGGAAISQGTLSRLLAPVLAFDPAGTRRCVDMAHRAGKRGIDGTSVHARERPRRVGARRAPQCPRHRRTHLCGSRCGYRSVTACSRAHRALQGPRARMSQPCRFLVSSHRAQDHRRGRVALPSMSRSAPETLRTDDSLLQRSASQHAARPQRRPKSPANERRTAALAGVSWNY